MKKNIKISLTINIIITILTIIASIIMFTGFRFMSGNDVVLESTKIGMFKFFTVDSNIFMGIAALIFSILEIKLLKGNIDKIPKSAYIMKYMATSSVTLTCFIVFVYLGPITSGGVLVLLKNSNLFFHLIIPVLSIINYIFFEKTNLSFKTTIYGIIPTILYGIFYLINILIHMENGSVSTKYDWYWFVQNGVWTSFIVMPIILLISYIISIILWKCNKKNLV